MSQNSLVIPNTGTLSGLTLVNDTNGALDTLNTLNSGGSAPSAPEADQFWVDTTNGLVKQRDPGNATWNPQWVRGVPHGGGMRFSGQTVAIASSGTLTNSVLGQLVLLDPSAPITMVLPKANTFPIGTGFVVYNFGTATITFTPQGGDAGDLGLIAAPGDQFMMMSDGTSYWRTLLRSTEYSQGLTPGGSCLRLPGGVIMQFGSLVVTPAAGGVITFTFLEPFPTNCFSIHPTVGDSLISGLTVMNNNFNQTLTGGLFVVNQNGVGYNAGPVRINYTAYGN